MTDNEKILARLSRLEKFVGMVLDVCGICRGLGRTGRTAYSRARHCAECNGLGTVITNQPSKEDQ